MGTKYWKARAANRLLALTPHCCSIQHNMLFIMGALIITSSLGYLINRAVNFQIFSARYIKKRMKAHASAKPRRLNDAETWKLSKENDRYARG
jgi:hypothetical protein